VNGFLAWRPWRAARLIWWVLGVLVALTMLLGAFLLIAFRGGSFPTG
jgi:hypothetical protein